MSRDLKVSALWALAGVLAIFLRDVYIHPSRGVAMDTATALVIGIFCFIVAWRKAGGAVLVPTAPIKRKAAGKAR